MDVMNEMALKREIKNSVDKSVIMVMLDDKVAIDYEEERKKIKDENAE